MTRRGLDGKINRNRALFDAEPFAVLGRAEQRERPEQEEAEHAETKSKVFSGGWFRGFVFLFLDVSSFPFLGKRFFFALPQGAKIGKGGC